MSLLQPTSIRQRLLRISAAISMLTLSVAGALFIVNDIYMLQGQMVRDLEVLSAVVGENSLSALVFDAPETAEKNLASLRREKQIRYAALYDAEGQVFARYIRDDAQAPRDPQLAGEGVLVDFSLLGGAGTVEVVRDLVLEGSRVGQIYLHAGMEQLATQLRHYAAIAGVLLLLTLVVSLLLALRLQRRVSDPILQLAAKTQEISAQADYALRCPCRIRTTRSRNCTAVSTPCWNKSRSTSGISPISASTWSSSWKSAPAPWMHSCASSA